MTRNIDAEYAPQQKPRIPIDVVKKIQRRLDLAYKVDRDNQIDAAQDLRFLGGDQWPATARQEREAQNRPTLTLNRLPQFVNQVVNGYKENPAAVKAVPADDASEKDVADIFNGIMSEIDYRSNGPQVIGGAFGHAVSCGIGHFRIITEYESDESLNQVISYRRIHHPLAVFWDPDAHEPDRSDAMWCIVTEIMTFEAFKEQYPDKAVSSVEVPHEEQFGASRLFWRINDMVTIAEYWEKIPKKRRIALHEGGGMADITDFSEEQMKFMPPIKREREVESFEVRQWLVSASDVLDGGMEGNKWAGKYIPIIPIIGHEVPQDDKIIRRGLVRDAKDPQQLYNFMRSSAVESIGLQTKAPYLATPAMIGEFKGQWDTHNITARPYLLYKPDQNAPGGMPQRIEPPALPAALVQSTEQASDEMKAVTGIFDASLGQRSNETSGKGIMARANQGSIGTFHFIDNLNISLTHAGRVIIDLIPKIYDSERVVKLMSEEHEDPQFKRVNQQVMSMDGMPMIQNDLSKGRFQVRIRVGPSYLTRRLEAADSMIKFVGAVPQAAQFIGDLIAQNMDWPGADKIAQRLQRAIPPQILGDDQPELTPQQQQAQQQQQEQEQKVQQFHDQMAQLTLQEKQAGIQKTGAETQLKGMDAMLRQAEGMIAQIHAKMAQLGIPTPQTDNGYPNPNGYASASQQPQEDANHLNTMNAHDERGASLDNMLKFEQWRQASARADEASMGTQSRELDIALKRQKLGQSQQPQL